MAWLNAVPKPDERTRRAKAGHVRTHSRLDEMRARGRSLAMPFNPAPVVTSRLMEIGLNEAAGMGVGPISWQAIAAWAACTGIDLPAWQARLIRTLSIAYVAEGRRAESENCPPPWRSQFTQQDAEAEEAQLRALLG